MKLIQIKLIFFLSVCTIQSCHIYKKSNSDKEVKSSVVNIENKFIIDTTCIFYTSDDCHGLFNCHYTNFLNTTYPFIFTKIDKSNDIGDFLKCAVKINKLNDSFYVRTNIALKHYFMSKYMEAAKSNGSPLISGVDIQFNRFYRILYDWNCKESFEICVLYMGKNWHDSMGHGDCTNVGVKFFDRIVAPKIKTIYGQDLSDYLGKHLDYDPEKNYEDCFDSFYNSLYPLIKKAWEEGKIELHAPDLK